MILVNQILPELTINKLDYSIDSGYYTNVHRYVTDINDTTPPTDTTQDNIVGMVIPNGKGGGLFIDISSFTM